MITLNEFEHAMANKTSEGLYHWAEIRFREDLCQEIINSGRIFIYHADDGEYEIKAVKVK